MISGLRVIVLLLLFSGPLSPAQGGILVLVHGWAADADTWLHSGVAQTLESQGWPDAGVLLATPAGVQHIAAHGMNAGNRVYRAALPAAAPLEIQAGHLFAELVFLQHRFADEPLYLVGHSAGGLVSRLVAIRPQSPRIAALITIATPNLGTERALQGLDYVNSKPFFCPGPGIHVLKNLFAGDRYRYLDDSQGVMLDLLPATPGTLIGWLNQQPHPDIPYYAIVRSGPIFSGMNLCRQSART